MKYLFKEFEKCPFCEFEQFKILGKRLNKSQGLMPHKKIGITTTIVKCKNCGLVFPNPLPIPESIQDHYGIPPLNYWKPKYFDFQLNFRDGILNWMNRIQKVDKNAKILDIGTGIGKTMIAFSSKGYNMYGVEPSKSFYELAISKMGVDEKKLKLSSIEECEYEENSFDVIIFTAVLEHLYEPAMIIYKIMQWLKPNGLVYIQVPSSNWAVNKLVNFIYKLTGKDYVANLSPMHEPYHLYEFSKKSFEIHSIKNNYEIADFQYYICETFMPKMFDSLLKGYMKRTNTGMELAIWLRKKI